MPDEPKVHCPICGAEDFSCAHVASGRGFYFETGQEKAMPFFQLTKRTFVNADRSKVVPEGAKEAAFLLGAPGQMIDLKEAVRLGLVDTGQSVTVETMLSQEAVTERDEDADLDDPGLREAASGPVVESEASDEESDEAEAPAKERVGIDDNPSGSRRGRG